MFKGVIHVSLQSVESEMTGRIMSKANSTGFEDNCLRKPPLCFADCETDVLAAGVSLLAAACVILFIPKQTHMPTDESLCDTK
jgi:hypothetical protein